MIRDLLSGVSDPTALARAAGVELPSAAIGSALRGIYGVPPQPGDLSTWRTISRQPWPNRKARRVAACIGRRGLKSTGVLAWSCVHEILRPEHDEHAAKGSRVYGIIVAPFVPQARESVRAIRGVLDQLRGLGIAYTVRDPGGATEIVLRGTGFATERVVQVMTADAVSVRGFAVAFAGYDECGFLPHGEQHATRDVDIVRAIGPAMVQFPASLTLFVSSPGAPGSLFQRMVEPSTTQKFIDPRTTVIRAPSWVTNPRITEAACLQEAGGDVGVFEQEYAARRFGYLNESFIDTRTLVPGSPHADLGPRPGSFIVGLDVAQLHDQTAIVVCSSFEVEVVSGHAPIRHLVVEHAEVIESSKTSPTPIAAIASRVRALSAAYSDAPVVHDPYMGPVVKAELVRVGFREFFDPDGEGVPPMRSFCQRSMDPARQTPRWRTLKELVHGQRLHLGADHHELVHQLSQLRATQLSSGALKVEGKRDDLADALALAAPVALKLPPTDGPDGGTVEFRAGSLNWGEEGLIARGSRFVRRMPNGAEVPTDYPEWAPGFAEWAEERIAEGVHTPSIDRYLERKRAADQRGNVNATIRDQG